MCALEWDRLSRLNGLMGKGLDFSIFPWVNPLYTYVLLLYLNICVYFSDQIDKKKKKEKRKTSNENDKKKKVKSTYPQTITPN
jgi:uncharacterized membrane protein